MAGVQRGDFLNLRQGPGQNYPIVQRLENGVDGIKLLGNVVNNGGTMWQKIESRGVQGWVAASYLAPDSRSLRQAVAQKTEGLLQEPKQRSGSYVPGEVKLTRSTTFPTFDGGVPTGLSALPVGTKVRVLKIAGHNLVVEYQGQKKSIPANSTDLSQRMLGLVED